MAIVYVWDGATGAANGTSWTDAYVLIETGFTNAANGDTIYVHYTHTEGAGSTAITLTGGTVSAPKVIISVDKDSSDAFTPGALCDCASGAADLTLAGVGFSYGVDYTCADDIVMGSGSKWHIEGSPSTYATLTHDSIVIINAGCQISLQHCEHVFEATSSEFFIDDGNKAILTDVKLAAGSAATNDYIGTVSGDGAIVLFNGLDLTGMASTGNFLVPGSSDSRPSFVRGTGLKLPSSGSVVSATFNDAGSTVEIYNVGTGNTAYAFHIEDSRGVATEDTTQYRDATYDGTNGYSVKVVTTSAMVDGFTPFRMLLAEYYAAANGTHTVQLLTDGVTLQNDEFFVELIYPDATTGTLMNVVTSRAGNPISPANLSTSTEVWTETLTSDTELEVAVTATSGAAGIHQVWINVAKPSSTVYIDPEVDVT